MPRLCTSCARGSIAHSANVGPGKSASSASLSPDVRGAGDMAPRAFGYRRHPSGIYAGRSSAPSVKRRAGVGLYYEAPQETETEMPFLDDVDSPEVSSERQRAPSPVLHPAVSSVSLGLPGPSRLFIPRLARTGSVPVQHARAAREKNETICARRRSVDGAATVKGALPLSPV